MHILQLDSGLFPEQSITRKLTAGLVKRLLSQHPGSEVTYRDLALNPPTHLSASILMAAGKPEDQRSKVEAAELALSQTLIDEIFAADVLVIGTPMYNFSIPSSLKAWIDRVLQAGKTFRYTDTGAEGLVTGKKVYIASSRGGIYSEGPAAAIEHQESYLMAVLNFIGITDIQTIRAEGVNLGEEVKAQAVKQGHENIATL